MKDFNKEAIFLRHFLNMLSLSLLLERDLLRGDLLLLLLRLLGDPSEDGDALLDLLPLFLWRLLERERDLRPFLDLPLHCEIFSCTGLGK